MASLELQVLKGRKDSKVLLDQWVLQDQPDRLAPLGSQGLEDQQDNQVNKAHKEKRVEWDQLVKLDLQAVQATEEHLELLVSGETKAQLVTQATQDLWVHRVLWVKQEKEVWQGQRVLMARKAFQVSLDSLEVKVSLVSVVRQGIRVLKEKQGLLDE
jgi:hypothetical protein